MTFLNAKRLYDHYLAEGNMAAAANLLKRRPQLAEGIEEVKDEDEEKSQKKKK